MAERGLAALGAGVLAAALLFGGGLDDGRLFWIGSAAVLAAGAGAALVLLGRLPPVTLERRALALLVLFTATVAWSGCSILWSIQPDRSWSVFNRGLVYLALLGLGLLLGAALPRAPRRLAVCLCVLLALVLAWALLGKVVPALGPDVGRNARLRSPVGYWNALALLGVMTLALALWLSSEPARRHAVRAAGAVLAFGAMVAIVLTYSRGGIAIAGLTVVVWLLLGGPVVETLAVLAVAAPVALSLSGWAFTRPALVEEAQAHADRVRDGAIFGVLLAAGAAAVFMLARAASRLQARRPLTPLHRARLGRRLLAGAAVAGTLLLAGATIAAGGPRDWLRDFANPATELPEDPARLGALSSNHRWAWWGQSLDSFEDEPYGGTGAGSFGLAHRLFREEYTPRALGPHNLPLQWLGELGLIGFLLGAGAALAAFLSVRSGLRRLTGDDRAAGAALAACLVAYGLHLLIDTGWDYVAISAPALIALGVLASAGHCPGTRSRDNALPGQRVSAGRARRRPLTAFAVAGLALVAVSSLGAPWLAARRLDQALDAFARDRPAEAASLASEAHRLNPLAVDPLHKQALAEERLGHRARAAELYEKAARLQPRDPETWYELGLFELEVRRNCRAAYVYLDRSWGLDRHGPAGERGGALDRARAAVDSGRC